MGGVLDVRGVGGEGGELELKGEGDGVEIIMDEVLEVGIVAEEESETEGSSTQGDRFVSFKTGKAAFGEGSGMLKYESSKISS